MIHTSTVPLKLCFSINAVLIPIHDNEVKIKVLDQNENDTKGFVVNYYELAFGLIEFAMDNARWLSKSLILLFW